MFRLALVVVLVGAMALLGLRDIVLGNALVGVASICLAVANGILLTR